MFHLCCTGVNDTKSYIFATKYNVKTKSEQPTLSDSCVYTSSLVSIHFTHCNIDEGYKFPTNGADTSNESFENKTGTMMQNNIRV